MTEVFMSDSARSSDDLFAFPLSFAQERLWFLDRLEPGSSAYNIPLRLRLTGALDVRALEYAFETVISRHEILRTRFFEEGGEPYQAVTAAEPILLPVIDLSVEPDPAGESLRRVSEEDGNSAFDLSAGPPVRATLVRLAEQEHVLMLTMHHIVADGWSTGILFRELGEAYRASREGRDPQLPDLPLQYADFAVWQRDYLGGERLQRELDFWTQDLQGAPVILDLPTDHPRPAVQSDRGAHERRMLDVQLAEQLKKLARTQGATLFMTLLAGFGEVLARYSGQRDILIGSPIANRNRVELEGLIGSFANTIVLRTDLTGNPSFRELLHRVRERTLGAYAHQDLPFEKLVEVLNPGRDLSRAPVFQVMLALQNFARTRLDLPDLTLSAASPERGTAKFDLALFVREQEDGLLVSAEYDADLFEPDSVGRLLGHFETLLAAAVADPDRPVVELPILTEPERRLLEEWNDTSAPYRSERCLDELFVEQARMTPAAIAVEYEDDLLTYAELDDRSSRLARHLQSLDVGPGSLVGICCERSPELMVAIFGVLKTGAAYVPIEPSYPSERKEFMLADSEACVLLTQDRLVDDLSSYAGEIVRLDGGWPAIAARDGIVPRVGRDPEQLAYVIYTSGSTGRPKGVEIRHRSVVNLMEQMRLRPGLDGGDVLVNLTTPAFDLSVPDLYLPLLNGGRLVIAPREATFEADEIAALFDRVGATFVQATPTTWRMLVESGWTGRPGLKIVCGGEAVPRSLANELVGRGASLWHMYGPTETTVWSSIRKLEPGDVHVPIGGPIANTRFYVLDEELQPVPAGVPGQLFIGGDGVARGYLNRPGLTGEKFIPDPYGGDGARRLYATGDRMRYRIDGTLAFLGRIDHQVKLHGFRIELGEIESVLAEHPNVGAAVAVVREDSPGEQRLVAYVVPEAPPGPAGAELRELLRPRLPQFMIPSAFVMLDELPLTPNGKIDRNALPEPDGTVLVEADWVEPRDDVERTLAEIWRSMLRLDVRVGATDDFFELGGHSLLAVRLFSEIERVFGVRLPLAMLFQGATVEHLAGALRPDAGDPAHWSPLVPLRAEGTRPPLFLIGGVDGSLLFYRDLVRRLDADQPVWGLQPRGLDGRTSPYTRFDELAAHYVEELRKFRPSGPYLIGGHCFSGVVAYEMSRQLLEQGEQAALVAIIDGAPRRRTTRLELERRKFADFIQRDLRGKLSWIDTRVRGLAVKVRNRIRWALYDLVARTGRTPPRALWDVEAASRRALSAYATPSSVAEITLFRAVGEVDDSAYLNSFWNRVAGGGVDIRPLFDAGIRHDNMLYEPFVGSLAAELEACIQALQRDELGNEAA